MERLIRSGWLVGIILALGMVAGCGGGGGGGGKNLIAPPPPGGGDASNLVVNANVLGVDTAPGTFETSFTVTVQDTLGAGVTGATVTIASATDSLALVEDLESPGLYVGMWSGYTEGTHTLRVTAGSGQATGTVVAPDIHTITFPTASEIVEANKPLKPTWTRTTAAEDVILETKDHTTGVQADDGEGTIPTPGNPARNDQRVRITRSNSGTIPGAAAGSSIQASIRNSVEPVVAQ